MFRKEEVKEFAQNFAPQYDYLGEALFPVKNFSSVQVAWGSVAKSSNLPVIAEVSALDAEAPIRNRDDFKVITAEALLIKHKINLTETENRLKKHGYTMFDEIKERIYDDLVNLYNGVIARIECMRMELIATGKISIVENNVNTVIDYNYDAAQIFATDLTNASTDVFDLIDKVKRAATDNGKKVRYAVVSDRVIGLLRKNTGLMTAWKNSAITIMPTQEAFVSFLEQAFGISFFKNDDAYRYMDASGNKVNARFFPDDRITFICVEPGANLGVTAICPTPEDENEALKDVQKIGVASSLVWATEDPSATWTKLSAVALPIPADTTDFYIVYTK